MEVGKGRKVKEAHVNDDHNIEMDFDVETESMNIDDAPNEENIVFDILSVSYDSLFETLFAI